MFHVLLKLLLLLFLWRPIYILYVDFFGMSLLAPGISFSIISILPPELILIPSIFNLRCKFPIWFPSLLLIACFLHPIHDYHSCRNHRLASSIYFDPAPFILHFPSYASSFDFGISEIYRPIAPILFVFSIFARVSSSSILMFSVFKAICFV